MPESIEDEPEFCGWLRRNDSDITNRAEAAQIVDLIEELMDEDVHELVTVYPHANLLIRPRKWNPALNMLLWAVLGGAFGWSIVAVMGWVFWHLPELWRAL